MQHAEHECSADKKKKNETLLPLLLLLFFDFSPVILYVLMVLKPFRRSISEKKVASWVM